MACDEKRAERIRQGYDNPMKEVVERIRALILAADPRIDECIKWGDVGVPRCFQAGTMTVMSRRI